MWSSDSADRAKDYDRLILNKGHFDAVGYNVRTIRSIIGLQLAYVIGYCDWLLIYGGTIGLGLGLIGFRV